MTGSRGVPLLRHEPNPRAPGPCAVSHPQPMNDAMRTMLACAKRNARDPDHPHRNFGGKAMPVPHGLPLKRWWCLRHLFLSTVAIYNAQGWRKAVMP